MINVLKEERSPKADGMKTKILVLASNPQGTDKLRLDKEIAEIEDILERSHKREEFDLKAKLAVRVRDLQESIIKERPRLVHFCGHGAGSEGLILEAESGKYQLVNNQALGDLFKLFDTKIECVMLNACYSQVQAVEINQHINYVIGTKKQIQDKAAIAFTQGFYTALFNGEAIDIERAFNFGCNRIQLDIYESENRERKLVPVYLEERGDLVDLPQDEVLILLKKEPLTQIETEPVDINQRENYIWSSWKQEASKHEHLRWIEFFPVESNNRMPMRVSSPSPLNRNLKKGILYKVKIKLNVLGYYFLLLNRGLNNQGIIVSRYLVIPSLDFAPNPLLEAIDLIPQQNAKFEGIEFDAEGKEEYIGILLDKTLDLPWLNPTPKHPTLEWNVKHLEAVLEQLQNLDTRQVFYRDFEILS